jgi:gamma-glutamylcyclotransferase (GGCT)/AIG2-like uncharacterized protein YtfP
MTLPPIHNLFVYGSLRSGFQSPAYEYISRYFTLIGEGRVRGRLHDLGEYPAAKPTEDEAWIVGELYHVIHENELDWALAQLDDYEGVNPDYEEEQQYYRDQALVSFEGNQVPAWIYWYRGDVSGKPVVPSGDMLQYLRDKNK